MYIYIYKPTYIHIYIGQQVMIHVKADRALNIIPLSPLSNFYVSCSWGEREQVWTSSLTTSDSLVWDFEVKVALIYVYVLSVIYV